MEPPACNDREETLPWTYDSSSSPIQALWWVIGATRGVSTATSRTSSTASRSSSGCGGALGTPYSWYVFAQSQSCFLGLRGWGIQCRKIQESYYAGFLFCFSSFACLRQKKGSVCKGWRPSSAPPDFATSHFIAVWAWRLLDVHLLQTYMPCVFWKKVME